MLNLGPVPVQLRETQRELERSQGIYKEIQEARRQARDALADMAEQKRKLVQAYMDKKEELSKVSAERNLVRSLATLGPDTGAP